jgi:hypothetical protein
MLRSEIFVSLSIIFLTLGANATTTTTNTFKPFSDNSYILTWNIDEDAGLINITLDCATTGWVGIGFSDTGMMNGSDLVICYLTRNTPATCLDGYAKGYTFSKDEANGGRNDISMVSGSLTFNRTTISFSKKLKSGDIYDKVIAQGAEMKVLFSYRIEGNPVTENNQFNEHSIKIMKQLVLWPEDGSTSLTQYKYDANEKVMSIGVTRLALPAQKTFYACNYFNVKTITQNITQKKFGLTYHAVAFEPLITNSKRLYRLTIYSCKDPSKASYSQQAYDCTDETIPDNCNNVVLTWANGSGSIIMPTEAGIVWGSSDTEAVFLQLHYNNDDLAAGEEDSSQMNAYFTTNLRQYDVGTLVLGKSLSTFSIPAGQKAYDVKALCTSACTNTAKGNITVFGYTPEGNKLMSKVSTAIVNGDKSTLTLGGDPFSYLTQKTIQQNPPVVLVPGFSAVTTCTYDSSAKAVKTDGGLTIDNELCYNLVMYFPKENGLYYCADGEIGINKGCILNQKVTRDVAARYMTYSYFLLFIMVLLC